MGRISDGKLEVRRYHIGSTVVRGNYAVECGKCGTVCFFHIERRLTRHEEKIRLEVADEIAVSKA